MLKRLTNNIEIIWNLAINDFSTKYAGSAFGVFWAFFQPVITIIVYACVFQFGLKSTSPIEGVSYIFWFATGMVPWFFFSDAIRAVTNSLIEYSYLVKKVVFDITMLPIIKLISSLLVHLVFIVLLIIIAIFNHEALSLYAFQTIYYLICAIVLAYAIGKFNSAIILFFRDLGQIVNILLDIFMWATPIIWAYQIVPEKYQIIVKINPIYYIIEGYRDSFINHTLFIEKIGLTGWFWFITIILLIIADVVFKKLRPQFADVL